MSEPETKEEGTTQVNVQETVVAETQDPVTNIFTLPERRPVDAPRKARSLAALCECFLGIYCQQERGTVVHVDNAAKALGVERRRIYDILNVLNGFELFRKHQKSQYEWRGLDGLEERLEALKNEPTSGPSKDEEEGRKERAMARLTQRFSQLLMQSPNGAIELEDAAVKLLGPSAEGEKSKSKVRRLYDIANIMCALGLIAKANMDKAKTWFKWLGPADVGSSIKAAALSDSVKELTSQEAAMASLSPEMLQMMNMSLMFPLPFPMNESFANPPGLMKSNLSVPGAPTDEVAGTGTGTSTGTEAGIGTGMGIGIGGAKKRELTEAGPSSTGEGAEGDGQERPAKRAEVDGTGKQLADLPPLAPLWTAPFPLLWNPGMVSGDGTGVPMDPASASATMSAAASAAAMMPPPMASVLTQTGQWGPGISAPTMSSHPGSNQMDSNAMPSQLDLAYFQQACANFYASFLTKPGSEQPPGQEDINGNAEAKDDKRSVEPEAAEIKETEAEAQTHINENPMGQSS